MLHFLMIRMKKRFVRLISERRTKWQSVRVECLLGWMMLMRKKGKTCYESFSLVKLINNR